MRLYETLDERLILPKLKSTTKSTVLKEFVSLIKKHGLIKNMEEVYDALMEREKQTTTGIGRGIAIPHCKLKGIDRIIVALGRSKKGIDYKSLDSKPVNIFFVILSPVNMDDQHIKTLSAISKLLKHIHVNNAIMGAKTAREIMDIITREEEVLI